MHDENNDDENDHPFRRKTPRKRSPFDVFGFGKDGDFNDILRNLENILSEVFQNSWQEDSDFPKPFVWGLSFNRDSDGNTKIEKFGNFKSVTGPDQVDSSLREPLVDIMVENGSIRVIVEIPGVDKKDIHLTSTSSTFKLRGKASGREYIKELALPVKIIPESAKAKFKNGVLEVVFQKKEIEEHITEIDIE